MNIPTGLSGDFYEMVSRTMIACRVPDDRVCVVSRDEFDRYPVVQHRVAFAVVGAGSSESLLGALDEYPHVMFADLDSAEDVLVAKARFDALKLHLRREVEA